MRSLFSSAPFTRFDLGNHVLSVRPQLGFSFKDVLSTVGFDDSDISKIQDPAAREEFKVALERCRGKGLETTQGIVCMAELSAKVYAKLQEQGKMPLTPMQPVQQPSSFPFIPVAIAALAAGGLIWFLATRAKK
jgi:hypothetical protein